VQRSLHLVEVDIFQLAYRSCRPHQERIADYYMSGRPRFEWEKLREKMLIDNDQTMINVCASCGLNILAEAEGCKIRIEGLTTFLGIIAGLDPQTRLSGFSFSDDILTKDDTRVLHEEVERLSETLNEVMWPVAQLFEDDEPCPDPSSSRGALFYEFEGGNQMTIVYSNRGYTVGIGREGIMVSESLGTVLPERFVRLWKDGANVYGETIGERHMPFLPVENELPAWDDSPVFAASELRLIELPLLDIYADVVESLLVFSSVALANNTGLRISAVG